MPSALITLEDLDMNDTEDEIKNQEDNSDRNIRDDIREAPQSCIHRCIWRTSTVLLILRVR